MKVLTAVRNFACHSFCKVTNRFPGVKLAVSRFSTIVRDDSERDRIIEECLTLRQTLQPINDRIGGPLEKDSLKNTILPFVFLLGNHSSGKSSFVNYVFQRKVTEYSQFISAIFLLYSFNRSRLQV